MKKLFSVLLLSFAFLTSFGQYDLTGSGTYTTTSPKAGSYSLALSADFATGTIIPTSRNFTVSAWCKSSVSSGVQIIAAQADAFWVGLVNGFPSFHIGIYPAEAISQATSTISDGNWHHLAISINALGGSQYYWLWVDGVRQDATQYPSLAITTTNDLTIGHMPGGINTFIGQIDEVAIYEGAQFGIGSTITVPTSTNSNDPSLITYYPFENSGVNAKAQAITSVANTTTRNGNQYSAISSFSPFSSVSGGTLPYVYSISSGTLQTGLSLNTSTGVVSGTPTVIENQSVTFAVKDATNTFSSTTSTVQINISAPAAITATASTASKTFTSGDAITPFQPLTASGGVTPYTYMVSPSLPTGLALNATTGQVTGTPTVVTSGTYTFSVKDVNNVTASTTSAVSITINAGAIYTLKDTTDLLRGEIFRILVPNLNSHHPYNPSNPTKVVVYCHGLNGDYDYMTSGTIFNSILAYLDSGYICVSSRANGASFGNQVSVDDNVAMMQFIRLRYNVRGFFLIGESMGGLTSLNLISENKVSGIVGWIGIYPICSLKDAYTGKTTPYFSQSFATQIDAAYGCNSTTYAYKTVGSDPLLKDPKAFGTIYMKAWHGYGDTMVNRLYHTDAFEASVSSSAKSFSVVTTAGNHGDYSNFNPAAFVSFSDAAFADPPAASGKVGETTTITTNAAQSGYFKDGVLHKIN